MIGSRDPSLVTVRRLATRLEVARISYAISGGAAVRAHGARPMQEDVEVVLTPDGLTQFAERLGDVHTRTTKRRGRRFHDSTTGIQVDILVTGHAPGPRQSDCVEYPRPSEASVVLNGVGYLTLLWLIQVKLARHWFRDLADVVSLILANNLDETFGEHLHPSVRADFIECLGEKRREEHHEP
jgi:hypothetical protein